MGFWFAQWSQKWTEDAEIVSPFRETVPWAPRCCQSSSLKLVILTNISSSAEVLTGLGMALMRDSFIIAFNFKDFYLRLYFTSKCLQIKSLFFEELVERKRREQITWNPADNSKPRRFTGIQPSSSYTLLLHKSNLLTSSREMLKLNRSTPTQRRWPLKWVWSKCWLCCLFYFNQHWESFLYGTNYLMESKKTGSCCSQLSPHEPL